MDVLRNNEEQVMCPYNAAHYIRKCRMEVHLKKCRKAYKESEVIVICDFNASHRVPEPELQYHHDICPDRKTIELHVFNEENFVPSVARALPPVSVPVDASWDDEEVPSYNPQKYCEENDILRRLDTESAATRRNFRISERHRINNLAPSKKYTSNEVSNSVQQSKIKNIVKKTENSQNLPPIPVFSESNIEDVPTEITKMMEKVSIIPKAAVIPKKK